MIITPKNFEDIDIQPKSKYLIITMALGKIGEDMLDVSFPSITKYATKCTADIYIHRKQINEYLLNDKFIISKLLPKYKRVFWVDADVIIKSHAPNLFTLNDDIIMVNEWELMNTWDMVKDNITKLQTLLNYKVQPLKTYYNSGLMCLGQKHTDLIQLPNIPYINHRLQEQHTINIRIQHYNTKVYDMGNEMCWMYWFDSEMKNLKQQPFIHFCGAFELEPHKRLELMKEVAKDA